MTTLATEAKPTTSIERLGKILALAENAATKEEAEAAMATAFRLAAGDQVLLELARQKQQDKTKRETPVVKSIRLWSMGDRKVQQRAAFINLFSAIAEVNDVKLDIYSNNSGVIAYGFPSDIEVVELLFNSLRVQMQASGDAYIYSPQRIADAQMVWNPRTGEYVRESGQSMRKTFYAAFTSRVGERLRAAKREVAQAPVVDNSGVETTGALVLASKSEEVRDFYKATSTARGSWRGSSGSRSSSAGARSAGRSAGSNARLGASKSIGGSRTAIG